MEVRKHNLMHLKQSPEKNSPYLSTNKAFHEKNNKINRWGGRRVRTHESVKVDDNWRITKKSSWKITANKINI